jgi:hypothetical protein
MEICKEEASGSGNQQFSFEIGRASSGQSVSALSLAKHRKTQQMRLRSSPIRCKTPQNDAKRSKCTRGRRQFTANRRKNSNYIRDSVSQDDSNDQKSNHENSNENESGLHGNMQGRGHWEWKSTVQRSVLKLDVLILVNPSQTLSFNRLWIYLSHTLSQWILMLLLMLGLIQIEYPFSKRSLPLRCFKGKNIIIVLIISYLWQFFQNGKISRNSHVLCAFQFHDQIKGS